MEYSIINDVLGNLINLVLDAPFMLLTHLSELGHRILGGKGIDTNMMGMA